MSVRRSPTQPVFPSSRGGRLSEDAVERLVAKHVAAARQRCPSLAGKRVTPHTLRHTAAMQFLQRGVDRSVIALWLGHESIETTQIYLHADLRLKEKALARTALIEAEPRDAIAPATHSWPSWRASDYPASVLARTRPAAAGRCRTTRDNPALGITANLPIGLTPEDHHG